MSILDSNLKSSVGNVILKTLYFSAQVDVTNNDYQQKIDCRKYKTLQIECYSSVATEFSIKGTYARNGVIFNDAAKKYWRYTEDKLILQRNGKVPAGGSIHVFLIDVSTYDSFIINKVDGFGSLDLDYKLTNFDINSKVELSTVENIIEKAKLSLADIYLHLSGSINIEGCLGDVFISKTSKPSVIIQLNGLDSEKKEILFNDVNFPNLISGSAIEKVIIMPWARNATYNYNGRDWRINVITTKGQVYHNFPSRLTTSDGSALAGDEFLFDESVVWDLESRKHPVSSDADAKIATGKYEYFPSLPADNYTLYPSINQDNGYGNGGFDATITKTVTGGSKTFGRFYFPYRSNYQGNPMRYMGGYAPHPKLTMIGTYLDNHDSGIGARICVFATNDGGRQWYCIYEYGASTTVYDSTGAELGRPIQNFTNKLAFSGTAASGQFKLRTFSNIIPSAADKEPVHKFKLSAQKDCSIVGTSAEITVTSLDHGITDGQTVYFETGTGNAAWSWLANDDVTTTSNGNGRFFKAKLVNADTFLLYDEVHNTANNLTARHCHSINRCKDGYMVGSGEGYPYGGWIHWIPVPESDTMKRKYPWDDFDFIRINSTADSIQRPLGVILKQDDTVIIGVDNDFTPVASPVMPADRTATFTRSATGVWRGLLKDADSQAAFECIFESDEVCYFFREVNGYYIYIGQAGHIGISKDLINWDEYRIRDYYASIENFGGVSGKNEVIINNLIIALK